jgi:hypothetical protein
MTTSAQWRLVGATFISDETQELAGVVLSFGNVKMEFTSLSFALYYITLLSPL